MALAPWCSALSTASSSPGLASSLESTAIRISPARRGSRPPPGRHASFVDSLGAQVVYPGQLGTEPKTLTLQGDHRATGGQPARRREAGRGEPDPLEGRGGRGEPQARLVRRQRGELGPPAERDAPAPGFGGVVEPVQEQRVAGGAALPDPFDDGGVGPGHLGGEQQRERDPAPGQLHAQLGAAVQRPGVDPGQGHHQTCGHSLMRPHGHEEILKLR